MNILHITDREAVECVKIISKTFHVIEWQFKKKIRSPGIRGFHWKKTQINSWNIIGFPVFFKRNQIINKILDFERSYPRGQEREKNDNRTGNWRFTIGNTP